MEKLTVKQAACLAAIADHWARHNRPPTVAQIAIRLGVQRSNAHRLMDECRSKGYASGPITTGDWGVTPRGHALLNVGKELAGIVGKKKRKRA